MIRERFSRIRRQVSGAAARDDVAAIVRHHRIQASPGYRDAARYVLDELQRAELVAALEQFPADEQSRFWIAPSFQEWRAERAVLHLIEPADAACKLADYRDLKIGLIQRSAPFAGEAELVVLPGGLQESDYEGLDLTGKIVVTGAPVDQVRRLAVDRFGAVGILYDGMRVLEPVRPPLDLPDDRQYTSFWWLGDPAEKKCFGFVLSPRQGRWLRDLADKRERKGQPPVRLRALVESSFYDGSLDVVSALIPGQTAEQVVVVSHLCHPQPSANDNASGAAAALEAARALQALIAAGELPTPQRSIHFLWVPEIHGALAYLAAHEDEIPRMVAGINLDMVGGKQEENGATFILERPPAAASSFVPDLLERLREELFDDAAAHTGLGALPLFRYATTNFSGGSDHYVFSDPTVGVPMAMFIQMPDRFYHTSADTLDHIDPAMLARAAGLAAGFAYFVASAGERETTWLAHELAARFQARLGIQLQALVTAAWDGNRAATPAFVSRRLHYELARCREALDSLRRLWPDSGPLAAELEREVRAMAQAQAARAQRAMMAALPESAGGDAPVVDEWEHKAAALIPRRLYRGPAPLVPNDRVVSLDLAAQAVWHQLLSERSQGGSTLPVLGDYWANGRRTVLEIAELVEMETGVRDVELLFKRFEMLASLDLVELRAAG